MRCHGLHRTSHIRHRPSRSRGFTLIEAALTTVIIGTGVLAIVAAQQAYHQKNNWAQRTGTAMLLANEIRERMVYLPLRDPQTPGGVGPEAGENTIQSFDDVDDFAEDLSDPYVGRRTISPPINALGEVLEDDDEVTQTRWSRWAQVIEIRAVDPHNPAESYYSTELANYGNGGGDPGVQMMRVTVRVTYDGDEVTRLSWLATE